MVADTVIDPGTVVVEASHTPIAEKAVSAEVPSDHFALSAEIIRIHVLNYLSKLRSVLLDQKARVLQP